MPLINLHLHLVTAASLWSTIDHFSSIKISTLTVERYGGIPSKISSFRRFSRRCASLRTINSIVLATLSFRRKAGFRNALQSVSGVLPLFLCPPPLLILSHMFLFVQLLKAPVTDPFDFYLFPFGVSGPSCSPFVGNPLEAGLRAIRSWRELKAKLPVRID